MATLRNQDETDKLLAKLPASTYALWIGLSNTMPPWTDLSVLSGTDNKAEWRWIVDGKPPEWDHWAPMANMHPADPEPNNWNGVEGICAGVWGNRESNRPPGMWNDL
jgi:hypothetical protein